MKKRATQRAPVAAAPVKGTVGAGLRSRLEEVFSRPVNGASLAAFRIAVGLVMALEALDLCRPNVAAISAGTTPLQTYYTGADIAFHLPYPAFGWLPLLPPTGIHIVVGILAVAGLAMAAGFLYRLSATLVFVTWGYLWVVESTRTYWQSHYYLEVLLTFLLIWMPAARRFSVDAWLARNRNPVRTVPFWTILLLRGQLVIAYFYAGVAKLSTDWLLDAAPIRWVLADPAITRPYERWLTTGQLEVFRSVIESPTFAQFICWTGFLFDLTVGFLLLARRTRAFGLVLMIVFHTTNHLIIFDDIGWFPLVGVATALIFLNPDWPERFVRWMRAPRIPKPDWKWFGAGAVVFPVVGAALGWRSAAAEWLRGVGERHRVSRLTLAFVLGWLAWQGLVPLRHYLIAGDGRFTYEGMSFSWRLKGEARHAYGHQLYIRDEKVVSAGGPGAAAIHWSEWRGEKVVHRSMIAGRVDWSQLPEIVVLVEPLTGERIFHNPRAVSLPANETAIRDRIQHIWQSLHGRPPDAVRPVLSLAEVFEVMGTALHQDGRGPMAGQAVELGSRLKELERGALPPQEARRTIRGVRALVDELQAGEMIPGVRDALRILEPFALEGAGPGSGTLLLIEDRALLQPTRGAATRVERGLWKNGDYTRNLRRASDRNLDPAVMIVHLSDVGIRAKDLLPQICLFDSQDHPQQPAYIWWNSPKDLTYSKGIHVSIQAFFLRRYAQRVAETWEREYGRRPVVNAQTSVSFNGRPPQLLVDPEADLASVPVKWFAHNAWIRDLEMRRIPREILVQGRTPPGFSSRME